MVHVEPIWIDDVPFTFVHVELPKTDLLVISNDIGYIMCGALDVDLLNEKLAGRKIVAGRAVGVRTRDELLYAPLQKVTNYAKETYGWEEGMSGKEALLRLK
ncbi:YunC family protein [Piscibacillus sp. B03]|uniref:YunC family protein n=1 Tax=Piscibacillus sp. B03 TaxID=3457430 RepID=UPI003FCC5861